MKIDFYAPKKFFGTHAAALSGWLLLLLLKPAVPIGEYSCGPGSGEHMAFFLFPAFLVIYSISLPAYVSDWVFKTRVKKQFFLTNIFYDIFLDAGIVLLLVPFFWLKTCSPSLKNLLPLFALFIFIRVLKAAQMIYSKVKR